MPGQAGDCLSLVTGWPDPILAAALGAGSLASHVRLAFAWPNATSPMQALNKTPAELSHKDDLLIFERNISTGKTAQMSVPLQVQQPAHVTAYVLPRGEMSLLHACAGCLRINCVSCCRACRRCQTPATPASLCCTLRRQQTSRCWLPARALPPQQTRSRQRSRAALPSAVQMMAWTLASTGSLPRSRPSLMPPSTAQSIPASQVQGDDVALACHNP